MSNNYAISLKRSTALLAALTFMAVLTAANFASIFSGKADAAQLSSRSLTLTSSLPGNVTGSGVANDETNGSNTTHSFAFTTTDASVSTVVLRYCTTAIGTCNLPTGLNIASAASAQGTVAVGNYDAGTNNQATITLSAPWSSAGPQTVSLNTVVNPTATGTFFVRIVADSDDGTVASAIDDGIAITSKVAETLGFSTAAGAPNDPSTNCTALSGGSTLSLGDPTEQTLSITSTFDNYSFFRLYTNSANGTVVQYTANTLEKGSDNIDAVGTEESVDGANIGTEQFGLAIDGAQGGDGVSKTFQPTSESSAIQFQYADTTSGALDGAAGNIALNTNYDEGAGDITTATPKFSFVANTATTIASSSSYVECATAPVRYIANISPLTAAGTYTTKVVYSAVPQY